MSFDNNRLILRAWIDAILHHAATRLSWEERPAFLKEQFDILQADFKVCLTFNAEDWSVEIHGLRNLESMN